MYYLIKGLSLFVTEKRNWKRYRRCEKIKRFLLDINDDGIGDTRRNRGKTIENFYSISVINKWSALRRWENVIEGTPREIKTRD